MWETQPYSAIKVNKCRNWALRNIWAVMTSHSSASDSLIFSFVRQGPTCYFTDPEGLCLKDLLDKIGLGQSFVQDDDRGSLLFHFHIPFPYAAIDIGLSPHDLLTPKVSVSSGIGLAFAITLLRSPGLDAGTESPVWTGASETSVPTIPSAASRLAP